MVPFAGVLPIQRPPPARMYWEAALVRWTSSGRTLGGRHTQPRRGGRGLPGPSGAPLPAQTAPLRRGVDGVMRPTPGATPTAYCANGTGALGCPLPE